MSKPHLYCIHNRDWPVVNLLIDAPHLDPTTFAGGIYRHALDMAAGLVPSEPLSEEAMKLFHAQVRGLPNMRDLYGQV